MRTFAYLGDHAGTVTLGHRFPRGEPVGIADERIIAKLSRNPDFREIVSIDGVEIVEARSELEALREQAEAAGIKVDGRWKADRLKAELAKVR